MNFKVCILFIPENWMSNSNVYLPTDSMQKEKKQIDDLGV